jgi:hypothetical protein
VFNTQEFDSWLEWFLSRKSIEDYLAKTFQSTPAAGEEMHDLQDSPQWKNLKSVGKDKYNLVFGVYIDWFNPRGNRMAGMLLNNQSVRFGIDTPFRKAGFLWHYCTLLPESPSRSSLLAGKSVHCGIDFITQQTNHYNPAAPS